MSIATDIALAVAHPSNDDLEGGVVRGRIQRETTAIATRPAAPLDARSMLAALYATHARSVQRFLRNLLGDTTLAADATQETFARAFRRIESQSTEETKVGWLFGIARNVSLEYRKARRVARNRFADEEEGRRAPCGRRSPETELLGREKADIVSMALGELPVDRRAALLLRSDHGLSYEEIALALGWSVAKARVEVFRAREVLRATLNSYEGDAQ